MIIWNCNTLYHTVTGCVICFETMFRMEYIGKKVRNTFAALAILKHKWVSCTKFQVRLSILMLSTLILKGIIGQLFHCFLYLLSDFLTESRALWFWIRAAVMRNSDKIVKFFSKMQEYWHLFQFFLNSSLYLMMS